MTKPSTLSDAHVHLFNGSDLPVEGYVRYVLIPDVLPNAADIIPAFSDIALKIVKPFSPSIKKENRRLNGVFGSLFARTISEKKIATLISEHINDQINATASKHQNVSMMDASAVVRDTTALSYIRLAVLLTQPPFQKDIPLNCASGSDVKSLKVERETIYRLLKGEYQDEDILEFKDDELSGLMIGLKGMSTGAIVQIFVWVGKMFQFRTRHLKDYRNEMSSDKLKPNKLINLLVDYDEWLRRPNNISRSDSPSSNSSHNAQIEFWHDRRLESESVALSTFAGYDPLKHAHELKTRPQSSYFEALKDYAKADTIQGFKLYPPMGFRSFGNSELVESDNCDFIGEDGIGDSVVKWWGTSPLIGPAIDDALREFYTFTTAEDLPVMIHTKLSNYTAKNFYDRPSPEHIIKATKTFPNLRACLGHFTEAAKFIKAMENEPPLPISAVKYSSHLFTPKTPNIYADIGYMHDLLGRDRKFVMKFFNAVLTYCCTYPEAQNRLMFGSDWIMIAKEENYTTYVREIEYGLETALSEWRGKRFLNFEDNFFRKNFDNFLNQ